MQRGDLEEFRSLTGPRRRSLRHDKQQWAEGITSSGERHLLCGEIKDAFANFHRLRRNRTNTSTPLMSMDGKLLSDKASVLTKWQEYFSTLLNKSLHTPPPSLCSEAAASTPDPLIDSFPPTLLETHKAANKIKAGKAPGLCGIYPEYILHGGTDALKLLHSIFARVR